MPLGEQQFENPPVPSPEKPEEKSKEEIKVEGDFKKEGKEERQLGEELEDMCNTDQSNRKNKLYLTDEKLYKQNELKRANRAREIYQLYKKGEIKLSPQGSEHLAMIFQHGSDPEDYKIAHELARKAADGGVETAKWLQAAAEDRYLVSVGRKQKWGTQFQKRETGWRYWGELASDEESGITDEMRAEMGVPKRADQLNRIKEKYPNRDASAGHA